MAARSLRSLLRISRAAAALLPLVGAACQPLPHPFAEDVPKPGSPLLSLRDMASVAIAPVEGGPRATAEKLAPAMAKALQQQEIAASSRTTSLDSYHLVGRIEEMPAGRGRDRNKAALVALWELRDPSGKFIGERAERAEAGPDDWRRGSEAAVARLADAGATDLVPLIAGQVPVEVAPRGQVRLMVGRIDGAPGDGDAALRKAILTRLRRQDVAIVDGARAKPDLVLDAEITVGRPKAGKQHVAVLWRLRRGSGAEIGTVAQQNDVPTGLLDRGWGNIADAVAEMAQGGIMALVSRASSFSGEKS